MGREWEMPTYEVNYKTIIILSDNIINPFSTSKQFFPFSLEKGSQLVSGLTYWWLVFVESDTIVENKAYVECKLFFVFVTIDRNITIELMSNKSSKTTVTNPEESNLDLIVVVSIGFFIIFL